MKKILCLTPFLFLQIAGGESRDRYFSLIEPNGQDVIWASFQPRVVAIGSRDPVVFTVFASGNPTTLQLVRNSGDEPVTLEAVDANLYQAVFSAEELLAGHVPGDLHNFVGFLEIYHGTTRSARLNIFANVLDGTVPRGIPIVTFSDHVQFSPHLVNISQDAVTSGRRPEILSQFYQLFGDDYDFVAVVDPVTRFANRSYLSVRNQTRGIGLADFDRGSEWASAERLQGIVSYPIDSLFDLAGPGAMHEIGHRWINFLRNPVLRAGGGHWPIGETAYSLMGWSDPSNGQGLNFPWQVVDLGDDRFRLDFAGLPDEFHELDLYLMGLAAEDEVGQWLVFENQQQRVGTGAILQGPVRRVGIDEIVAENGPRAPSHLASQKSFRLASIVLSLRRLLTADEMAFFDHMAARGEMTDELSFSSGFRTGTAKPFFLATGGRGTLSTRLVTATTDRRPDLVFPHFLNGQAAGHGNRTRIIVRNNSAEPDSGVVRFQDQEGEPLLVPVDGRFVDRIDYDLGPWATVEYETEGTGPLQSGSVVVFSSREASTRIIGTEIFELFGFFVSIQDSAPLNAQQFYVSMNPMERTGLAVYNPTGSGQVLDLILVDDLGVEQGTATLTLARSEQVALFLDDERLFGDGLGATGNFAGTLFLIARDGGVVSATGLIQKSGSGALVAVGARVTDFRP